MKIANWEPSENDRICSEHFEKHCFYKTERKVCLFNGAVPTIFPQLPKYLQPVDIQVSLLSHTYM